MNRFLQAMATASVAAMLAASVICAQTSVPQNSQPPGPESGIAPGKKLVLKDGSFQLVREYQRNGDRIRYYSLERAAWEELPASMVDWNATAKAEAADKAADEALALKAHKQEQEYRPEPPIDVDASLEVAPGTFLPGGEGLFVVEGKSIVQIPQVDAEMKTDRMQLLKQVLSPIPIVPGKKNIQISGPHATLRINSENPEFYLREAPTDPEHDSSVRRSSRPGESGPEIVLVRAEVKGGNRRLQSVKTLFGEEVGEKSSTISLQAWQVAKNVFRYTLSQPLPAGEYALAEILPDGMNLYVWDFGVDERPKTKQ
jgi:hypothetical protein